MRSSGILLHISSLPSPYGIGTLGREAREFIDFLAKARQTYWQMLPVGLTGAGNSPYQSCSVHAGNPNFIDLRELCEQGLLEAEDFQASQWGDDPQRVDYAALAAHRPALLEKAYERGKLIFESEFAAFRRDNPWVEEYGLFLSLRRLFGDLPWEQWPAPAAQRESAALARYRDALREDIASFAFSQFLFSAQWEKLHAYAREKKIRLIGDVPIYVSMDSVDVWLHPALFQLDNQNKPVRVAGCPPDAFCEDGQLWGNPLYDWAAMKKTGFAWWQERVKAAAACFDAVRIDHFRGLESYWAVPYGEKTARNGTWCKGPGMALIRTLVKACPTTRFIAEDLGFLTPAVLTLLRNSGFPGMKVLEFAFDGGGDNPYLPHQYPRNCVCYTGTHDNETLLQWLNGLPQSTLDFVSSYVGLNDREGQARGVLRAGMSSVADTFVAQLQDWLELSGSARMNRPGTVSEENWSWRLTAMPEQELAEEIAAMTARYGRLPTDIALGQ